MTSNLIRTATALLLGSASLLSHGATVNLNAWAFANSWSNTVNVGTPNHTGPAGGFKGSVQFAAAGESGFSGTWSDFVTYCVELDESFSMPSGNMGSYSVVAGASYAKWGNANASGNTAPGTAHRLGRLLSYVGSSNTLVDTAAKSTSLQLAIWNVIYDNDALLGSNLFKSTGAGIGYNAYAETLLADSANYANKLDVYVLSKTGSQDFLLTRNSPPIVVELQQSNPVPEPASLALAMLALAAAGAVSRRRRA